MDYPQHKYLLCRQSQVQTAFRCCPGVDVIKLFSLSLPVDQINRQGPESPASYDQSGLFQPGNTKGGSITVPFDLMFDWFGNRCMTTDNCCFYLQNRL